MSSPYDNNFYVAVVDYHHDGDTSFIISDLGFGLMFHQCIRWYGLDAPELRTPEGKTSLAWLNQKLPSGTTIVFRSPTGEKDKYGRYLATVYLASDQSTSINDQMIAAGMAKPWSGHGPKPN